MMLSDQCDINFDYLVTEMSAKFFHHKVTVFHFVINTYLGDGKFETENRVFLLELLPIFSIHSTDESACSSSVVLT